MPWSRLPDDGNAAILLPAGRTTADESEKVLCDHEAPADDWTYTTRKDTAHLWAGSPEGLSRGRDPRGRDGGHGGRVRAAPGGVRADVLPGAQSGGELLPAGRPYDAFS